MLSIRVADILSEPDEGRRSSDNETVQQALEASLVVFCSSSVTGLTVMPRLSSIRKLCIDGSPR